MNTKVINVVSPSDNLKKLRELTEKLSTNGTEDYKKIVIKLKTMVDDGKKTIEAATTPQNKIKCYETMCSTITEILKGVKLK